MKMEYKCKECEMEHDTERDAKECCMDKYKFIIYLKNDKTFEICNLIREDIRKINDDFGYALDNNKKFLTIRYLNHNRLECCSKILVSEIIGTTWKEE